jgi:hypothetical protein
MQYCSSIQSTYDTSFCTDKAANIDQWIHLYELWVCKRQEGTSKYHAGDCPEGMGWTTAKSPENTHGTQKRGHHHSPFMVFIVFFIACGRDRRPSTWIYDSRRSFGRGRRGRGYPAEQDFNVGSIEFTQTDRDNVKISLARADFDEMGSSGSASTREQDVALHFEGSHQSFLGFGRTLTHT